MNILMIDTLRDEGEKQRVVLYNICFRNAGVGLMWYEGPQEDGRPAEDWRKHLVVHGYYRSIDAAVQGEIGRLKNVSSTEGEVQKDDKPTV